MKISVFGAGYVGAVSAACLTQSGYSVTAVDIDKRKLRLLEEGKSPIIEPGLEALLTAARDQGLLDATNSAEEAISTTDASIVCVGTPSRINGSLDTSYVENVCREIGAALKERKARGGSFHSVILRSTILPGTMRELVIPVLEEHACGHAGVDFGVGYFPEFLREGTAIKDFYNPGAVVFGALDEQTLNLLKEINTDMPVEPRILDITAAEAVKYANNIWHAVKICYANEIGNICSAHGIDSHQVMDVVCADEKLNISSAYMKPGFAFGGSCLPKDLRALRHRSKQLDVPTPMLDAALAANEYQIVKAYKMISHTGSRRVGLVGLTFKPDTDDLRESPLVELAERLHGRGFKIKIFDPNVHQARLAAPKDAHVEKSIPHLSQFLVNNLNEAIDDAEAVVIGVNGAHQDAVWGALGDTDKYIVDLVRLKADLRTDGKYSGICW